jgi:serine/threonine protein kinase
MELVEGPTLADRITQGPMSLEEALPVAMRIIEALDYAHDRVVIHRDLKPAAWVRCGKPATRFWHGGPQPGEESRSSPFPPVKASS